MSPAMRGCVGSMTSAKEQVNPAHAAATSKRLNGHGHIGVPTLPHQRFLMMRTMEVKQMILLPNGMTIRAFSTHGMKRDLTLPGAHRGKLLAVQTKQREPFCAKKENTQHFPVI